MIATSDLIHVCLGKSDGNWLTPSPIKMVFPAKLLVSCLSRHMGPHACLHSDETAVAVESKAVHQSGDEETSDENGVCPFCIDIGCES